MSTTTRTWLHSFSVVLAFGAISLLLPGRASAALTNNVPLIWNVYPVAPGAYLEAFEATTPDWAAPGGSVVAGVPSGLPARPNLWFSSFSDAQVLSLNDSTVITNSFTNTAGNVSFASDAVFVDMRILFVPLLAAPTATELDGTKLALYADANSNLVAAVRDLTWYTNSTCLTNLSTWYQLTVKLTNGMFNALVNDVLVFTNKPLNNITDGNVLKSLSFSGTGTVDNLYVSRGNPAYQGTLGSVSVPPGVQNTPSPVAGGSAVTDWLAGYFNNGTLSASADFSGWTTAQIDAAYLLNIPPTGDAPNNNTVNCSFGISAIDLLSTNKVVITCYLKAGTPLAGKGGVINGRIKLLGQTQRGGAWSNASLPVAPGTFVDGIATCTIDVLEGGFKFFDPQIVP